MLMGKGYCCVANTGADVSPIYRLHRSEAFAPPAPAARSEGVRTRSSTCWPPLNACKCWTQRKRDDTHLHNYIGQCCVIANSYCVHYKQFSPLHTTTGSERATGTTPSETAKRHRRGMTQRGQASLAGSSDERCRILTDRLLPCSNRMPESAAAGAITGSGIHSLCSGLASQPATSSRSN